MNLHQFGMCNVMLRLSSRMSQGAERTGKDVATLVNRSWNKPLRSNYNKTRVVLLSALHRPYGGWN